MLFNQSVLWTASARELKSLFTFLSLCQGGNLGWCCVHEVHASKDGVSLERRRRAALLNKLKKKNIT